jgi:hypothetical protein
MLDYQRAERIPPARTPEGGLHLLKVGGKYESRGNEPNMSFRLNRRTKWTSSEVRSQDSAMRRERGGQYHAI